MLSKQVCEYCMRVKGFGWSAVDEHRWYRLRKVLCPHFGGLLHSIESNPPRYCSYADRHFLNNESGLP